MTSRTREMPGQLERARVRPRTDVYETDEALILVADVPGADQDSIELALQDDTLVLRARSVVAELPDYERSFRLAADIDRDALTATLQNGRLRVVLEKRQPRTSRIEVRAG